MKIINGFSKLSKEQKIEWLGESVSEQSKNSIINLKRFWHPDSEEQKIFDDFSENTISNHFMPYGVAPNFMINGQIYCIPMVIEESSVVAAAANSAKFWLSRGGFIANVVSTVKAGQVHFCWQGDSAKLKAFFTSKKSYLIDECGHLTENMQRRGGGILDIELVDLTSKMDNYYQLNVSFETCDAMGANFINTVLECIARSWEVVVSDCPYFEGIERKIDTIMSILSNFTPKSLVRAYCECNINDLGVISGIEPQLFVEKFARAVQIAKIDPNRAVTHNKGIYNGVDAVVLATGNDFRAVEACGHAFASISGVYTGLTNVKISDGKFRLSIEIPLALGTVGGLTSLHPTAKASFQMLGNPDAKGLMEIIASVGLATNFAAVRSLVTTGIQKGHMKMHLLNICRQFAATDDEIELAKSFFAERVVSFRGVHNFLDSIRMVH